MTAPPSEHHEAASAGRSLARDLGCVGCGYNLRGLQPEGRCPECGKRVQVSLDATTGNAIDDPQWARRTALGARLYALTLVAALVAVIAALAIGYFRSADPYEPLLLAILGAGAVIVAICMFISTKRSEDNDGKLLLWIIGLRSVSATVAGAAMICCILLMMPLGWWGDLWEGIMGGVAGWGFLITHCVYLAYLAMLVRGRAHSLSRWGTVIAWHPVILLVVSCLVPVSHHRPPALWETILTTMFLILLPVLMILVPAAYAWVWSGFVYQTASREV